MASQIMLVKNIDIQKPKFSNGSSDETFCMFCCSKVENTDPRYYSFCLLGLVWLRLGLLGEIELVSRDWEIVW